MPSQKYSRRSAPAWAELIEQYQRSGLSGAQFCREQTLPYASFCKWRQRILNSDDAPAASAVPESSFVELDQWSDTPERPWRITLKLGNGVELLLSQP